MERRNVSSTVLRSVGYDPPSRTLEVEFRTGKIYRYYYVPGRVYRELLAAPVIGQYFNDHVRYGFTYEQMRAQPEAC